MEDDLDTLYRENRQYVFGACYQMLKNRFDAEDAVQDVFMIAMKKKPTAYNQKAIRGWLNTTARFECLKIAAKRRRTVSLYDLPEMAVESGLDLRYTLQGMAAEKTAGFIADLCGRMRTQFA